MRQKKNEFEMWKLTKYSLSGIFWIDALKSAYNFVNFSKRQSNRAPYHLCYFVYWRKKLKQFVLNMFCLMSSRTKKYNLMCATTKTWLWHLYINLINWFLSMIKYVKGQYLKVTKFSIIVSKTTRQNRMKINKIIFKKIKRS